MNTIAPQEAYDGWSSQYDTNHDRTRDMEALVLRSTLKPLKLDHVVEIGCGTGKNTQWMVDRAAHITAVDLSEGMLAMARGKMIDSPKVRFDHHISDFLHAATSAGLNLVSLREHFDEDDSSNPPRILSLLLQRS